MELSDDEAIIQISGKASHYVQSVVIVTSKGRHLEAGQPSGTSFNMYPSHKDDDLVFISGTNHGAMTSIAAHWSRVDTSATDTEHWEVELAWGDATI